jgi:hypothetical protein
MSDDRPIVRRWTAEELAATVAQLRPPTSDDVSITLDGERLDTFDKAFVFFTNLNRERAQTTTTVAHNPHGR